MQDKTIETLIDEEVIFDPNLRGNKVAFWSILLLAGYLKVVGKRKDTLLYHRYKVSLPNEEIRQTIARALLSVVSGGADKLLTYWDAIQALARGDTHEFTLFLTTYLESASSYFDTGGPKKELFYHGLVLGMASALSYTHDITSNRESGGGRYDIAITPKNVKHRGILIELKVAGAEEELAQVAHLAHKQIVTKAYATAMHAKGVKDIVSIGIAFRDKEVAVAS